MGTKIYFKLSSSIDDFIVLNIEDDIEKYSIQQFQNLVTKHIATLLERKYGDSIDDLLKQITGNWFIKFGKGKLVTPGSKVDVIITCDDGLYHDIHKHIHHDDSDSELLTREENNVQTKKDWYLRLYQ